MDIVIEPDEQTDSCYVAFSRQALQGGAVARTTRVDENIALDFDNAGKLLGLDIMNASKVLATSQSNVSIDYLAGVKEAAEMAGVRRSNFVRDFASLDDFPQPIGELASGRIWLRSEVSAYLEAKRGPSSAVRRTKRTSPPKRRSA
jgi:uncharacterized protein YuzE